MTTLDKHIKYMQRVDLETRVLLIVNSILLIAAIPLTIIALLK